MAEASHHRTRGGAGLPGSYSLTAWWQMDEQATLNLPLVDRADSHTGGLTLTDNAVGNGGVPSYTHGSFGEVAHLAGWARYLNRTDCAEVSITTGPKTYVGWVNPITLDASYRRILAKDTGSGSTRDFLVGVKSDEVAWAAWTSTGTIKIGYYDFGITTGNWYMFIFDFDPTTETLGMSINNGTRQTVDTGTGSMRRSSAPFEITSSSSSVYLTHYNSRFSIFDSLLTDEQKTWLYNGGVPRNYADI